MKKILMVILSVVGLLVVAALVVPFVVNVDKYRPMIVEKVNENINGKLSLGKLTLRLWGRIEVKVDGLELKDASGTSVVKVQDTGIVFPVMPLLTGHPELRFELNSPDLNVVKFKNGKMNVMSLMKESSAATEATAQAAPTTQAKPSAHQDTEIPAIAMRARLTFLIQKAKLAYKDEMTGDHYNINELNVSFKDVSLDREIPYEITAMLDMTAQKTMKITGPLKLNGSIKALMTNGQFEQADLKMDLKMIDLVINQPGMFEKAAGVPLGFSMKGTVGKDFFKASEMNLRLAQVELASKFSMKMSETSSSIDFSIDSNKIQIEKLGDLVAMIKQYGLNGEVDFKAAAHGPMTAIDYSAEATFAKIKIENEALKQPLQLDGSLQVTTNKLSDLTVKLAAKNFDLMLKGMLENFMAPRFKFSLTSNQMDMDGLFKASEKAAEARKAEASQVVSGQQPSATPAVDYNKMLDPLRTNSIAAAMNGSVDVSIKKMKSTGVVIDNFLTSFQMNNLTMGLKNLSMAIFGGTIKGNMSFNAKPAKPTVGTQINVANLSTKKMLESQVPFARNTVKGIITANMNIGGAGLNSTDVTSTWKGSGAMTIKEAVFSTIDFGPQIRQGVIDKLPSFAKSKVKIPSNFGDWKGDYQSVEMKFALDNGTFAIQSLDGKAYPNKGLDLKGSGTVNLKDYGLNMGLDLIDHYNWLGLDSTAKDKRYGHFAVSPHVKGTVFSPAFDWSSTVSSFAKNAAESKGKEELQKAIQGKVPGKAGDMLNKALGGSGGGTSGGSQPAMPSKDDVKKKLKGLFGH